MENVWKQTQCPSNFGHDCRSDHISESAKVIQVLLVLIFPNSSLLTTWLSEAAGFKKLLPSCHLLEVNIIFVS